jgi:hypothetical protein
MGKSTKSSGRPFTRNSSSGRKTTVFRHFLHLARRMQNFLQPAEWSVGRSGRHKMTFNLTSLQQIAVSVVGALFAASISISAAVGPVAQFI